MIRHIVMFRLSDDLNETELLELISRAKEALEALPGVVIPELLSLEVHTNINPREEYHFCLVADLAHYEDIDTYALHPRHQEIVREMIKPHLVKRACVDIEIKES